MKEGSAAEGASLSCCFSLVGLGPTPPLNLRSTTYPPAAVLVRGKFAVLESSFFGTKKTFDAEEQRFVAVMLRHLVQSNESFA